jgi:hypothetical protein
MKREGNMMCRRPKSPLGVLYRKRMLAQYYHDTSVGLSGFDTLSCIMVNAYYRGWQDACVQLRKDYEKNRR